MRNRAKCALCDNIIESFHQTDYVECSCGSIAIDGGDYKFEVFAHDFHNLIRLDDDGNEIMIKVIDEMPSDTNVSEEIPSKLTRGDMVDMLEEMCKGYNNLPSKALYEPVNHVDFLSALMLLVSIFKAE